MAKPKTRLPEKKMEEFATQTEYRKYCFKRYQQRCNYEYRDKYILRLNKRDTYPVLPK